MTITLPRLPLILAVCVAVPVGATVLTGPALASARTATPAATNACHRTDGAMARAELSARARPVHEVISPENTTITLRGDEPGFPVNLMTGTTLKETGSNLFDSNTEVVTFLHK
jgi:hypothetical protein